MTVTHQPLPPRWYCVSRDGTATLCRDDPTTGGLFACCQPTCPHERGVIENYGSTNSFGRPHTVHLRALNEDA